jgi:hypothetical protein
MASEYHKKAIEKFAIKFELPEMLEKKYGFKLESNLKPHIMKVKEWLRHQEFSLEQNRSVATMLLDWASRISNQEKIIKADYILLKDKE